jgi:hypothetical protein
MEIIFPAASVVVLMKTLEGGSRQQRFYMEHTDNVLCVRMHPAGKVCASGQVRSTRIYTHYHTHITHTITTYHHHTLSPPTITTHPRPLLHTDIAPRAHSGCTAAAAARLLSCVAFICRCCGVSDRSCPEAARVGHPDARDDDRAGGSLRRRVALLLLAVERPRWRGQAHRVCRARRKPHDHRARLALRSRRRSRARPPEQDAGHLVEPSGEMHAAVVVVSLRPRFLSLALTHSRELVLAVHCDVLAVPRRHGARLPSCSLRVCLHARCGRATPSSCAA